MLKKIFFIAVLAISTMAVAATDFSQFDNKTYKNAEFPDIVCHLYVTYDRTQQKIQLVAVDSAKPCDVLGEKIELKCSSDKCTGTADLATPENGTVRVRMELSQYPASSDLIFSQLRLGQVVDGRYYPYPPPINWEPSRYTQAM